MTKSASNSGQTSTSQKISAWDAIVTVIDAPGRGNRRGKLRKKLGREKEAVRHYEEMLARPELRNSSEVKIADEAVKRLGRTS